jgi:capsular exopolysaccharide synthesis family protein
VSEASTSPRYTSLRDYLAVVRRQRWLILLTTLVFGAAAYMLSASRDATYQTEASLSFREVTQDLALTDTPSGPARAPEALAAQQAAVVTSGPVVTAVARGLPFDVSTAALYGAVTTRLEQASSFVIVRVRWGDPRQAAAIANEFAERTETHVTRRERARLRDAASALQRRYRRELRSDDPIGRAVIQERIARLEALADFANPVDVTRVASVPAEAESPRPVRDTLLGLLVGLTFGIVAAFVRDALDRRLRGSEEIQAQMGLPLLGHISDEALGGAVVAEATGRHPLSVLDLEAFRILRTNLEFLDVDHPPRVVAVTSALPEEGKTTVASSLAAVYSAAGKETLLVECDLRRPTLGERLNVPSEPGLSDYLAGRSKPKEVLREVQLADSLIPASANGATARSATLVSILAGARAPQPAELLGSERFRTFLGEVRESYDVVVLDTAPMLSVVDTLEVIPEVDAVILCVRAQQTTREQASAVKAALAHLPRRPTGLVVTGVSPQDAEFGYYSYSYAYGEQQAARTQS